MGASFAVLAVTGCSTPEPTWCSQFEAVFNRSETIILSPDSTRDDVIAAFTERQAAFEALGDPDDATLAELYENLVVMGSAVVAGQGGFSIDTFYSDAILVEERCGELGEDIRLVGGSGSAVTT